MLFLTYSYARSREIGETIQCNNAWTSNIVPYNLYVHIFFVGGGGVGWRVGLGVCCTFIHLSVTCIGFLYSTLTISAGSTA